MDGLETTEMTAKKATEQQQQQQQQSSGSQGTLNQGTLNDRYGKIGISAVAGAVQHKGERRPASQSRFTAHDSD